MSLLEPHPLALIPPPLTLDEEASMEASLLKNGQLEDITLHEGKILNGNHKYRILMKHGIQPRFKEWHKNGVATPEDFVMAHLEGRNLTVSQKACVGAKLVLMRKKNPLDNLMYGRESGIRKTITVKDEKGRSFLQRTDVIIGKALGVGSTSIMKAAVLLKHEKPLFDKVFIGKLTINAAYQEHRRNCGTKNKKPEKVIINLSAFKTQIKIPSCFCYDSEFNLFIKTMNAHGWNLEVVFQEGKIYANWFGNGYPSVRMNWAHLTPEFEFKRAVIVAANDKKDKL